MNLAERILKHSQPVTESGCWIWTGCQSRKGYGRIMDSVAGMVKQAHRASYECFIGTIPAGLQVCHKCDTPPCVNPDHLFVGTNMDNAMDRIRKGRSCHVPKNVARMGRKPKLTGEQVRAVRAMRSEGVTYPAISEVFGVSRWVIGFICNKKSQSHVE